jgi:type II secretory pathway predicted ATPase ExeA
MSYLTLKQFDFSKNPFPSARLDSVDLDNVKTCVEMALEEKGLLSIIGPRGAGKSKSIALALPPNAQIVQPLTADRERMRIGAIEDSIVYDLSKDAPRRSAEARSRQIRPILGEAAQRGPVVLIIEEAHRLHHQTLRALKSLHELKWLGRGPLLTILLIGQKDPLALPSLEEVAKRCNRVKMSGLSEREATSYIEGTVGRVWTQEAASALAANQAARNYLDLQEAIFGAMDQALSEGRKTVELSDVYHATGGGLKEMAEQLGVTLKEIGNAIGKDKRQAQRIMSGERNDPEARERIKALLDNKRLGGKGEAEPAREQRRAVA